MPSRSKPGASLTRSLSDPPIVLVISESAPLRITSARFGDGEHAYDRVAFEADLPRIEFSTCDRTTGSGCTLIPTTDDGAPADFYPFFTNADVGGTCNWQFGNSIPGDTREFAAHNAKDLDGQVDLVLCKS